MKNFFHIDPTILPGFFFNWYRPNIDKKKLKDLMKRKDLPALINTICFFTLLIVSVYLAWISWGTWWAIPAFLIYGNIYSFLNARWHEFGLIKLVVFFLVCFSFYLLSMVELFFKKDQCPAPNTSFYDGMKTMVPTILKQAKDPSYHLPRNLPATP